MPTKAAMFLEKDMQKNTLWFNSLSMEDVDKVGGKNASLGEMVSNLANAGVSVPNGFATTSYAFNQFLDYEGLDERIHQLLDELDVDDVDALRKTGATIRQWVLEAPFPADLEQDIRENYSTLT
ncbi:phosphoenolpyruvate synthase, partial [Vibrio vulnificus]